MFGTYILEYTLLYSRFRGNLGGAERPCGGGWTPRRRGPEQVNPGITDFLSDSSSSLFYTFLNVTSRTLFAGDVFAVGDEDCVVVGWNRLIFATLKTAEGQVDIFSSQIPFKCYLPEVVSVGD